MPQVSRHSWGEWQDGQCDAGNFPQAEEESRGSERSGAKDDETVLASPSGTRVASSSRRRATVGQRFVNVPTDWNPKHAHVSA
jgi:hypothetical protein